MPEQSLKLKNVINVYQESHKYYIEIQNISNGKAAPARPLKKKEFRQLLGASADENYNDLLANRILPEHLITYNLLSYNYYIMWYRKAKKYRMLFTDNAGCNTGEINLPALLFMIKQEKLYVFALKDNKRPEATTKLFQPPLYNVSSDGLLCLGSMNLRMFDSIDDTINDVEYNFWNSMFAHTGSAHTKTSLTKLTNSLIESGRKFPVKELIETNLNVRDLLR